MLSVQGTLPVNILRKPFLRPGPLILDAMVHVPDLRLLGFIDSKFLPRRGFLKGEVHVTGSWDKPVGKVTFQGDQLYPPALLKPFPSGPLALSGTVSFDREDLVADSIQGDSPSLKFTCGGAWKGIGLLPSLLGGANVNLRGETHFQGDLTVKDLGWLAAGVSGLRRVSGRMAGTFAVAGPASNPTINATVRLSDGELRSDMDLPSEDGVNLVATMSPEGLHLKTFTGRLGGAPFAVTGSVQRKDGAVFIADLRLKGKNLLYYRQKGVKLRADTDVTFKGPLSRLEAGGTLAVTDGYFDQYFNLLGFLRGSGPPRTEEGFGLFSLRTEPFRSMTFDVSITAVNPFKIRSNLVTVLLRPDLKLGGTGEVPMLTGNVYLDSGRLILPAGNVSLETGVVRFTTKDPARPLLDVTGKSRMYGYDVSLVVEGPYDEPTVTLSSVPPLSNEEVLLLVLTGRRPVSTGGTTTA
ncbi:MAG: translocation/assembly module TamB domain-containing protein, partial [Deltaproteobacteria bacterium]